MLVHRVTIGRVGGPRRARRLPSAEAGLHRGACKSGKLGDAAWNPWPRETSNRCSRSSPPNHQPGAKPPKVGGLGVTPIPRWGRLCFRARKDPRDRMKRGRHLGGLASAVMVSPLRRRRRNRSRGRAWCSRP
jgi:hypothetical protein